MMPELKMLTRHTFYDHVFEEGDDCFVFVYTSSVEDQTQQMVAGKVNELAMKFGHMSISSVKFYGYDVNVENQPPRIESQEVPQILFFPAFHKGPPYRKFLGQPKPSEMAAWIQKLADKKFEITQDLAQIEQFQEMKMKQQIEEMERKKQLKMIDDELRRRGEL